ncbi:hypothetical protein HKD37_01G000810 [Glycine soja]
MAKPSTQLVAFPFSNDYRFDTEQGRTCKEVYIRSNQMEEKQENIPSSNTHKRKSLSALGMTLSVLFDSLLLVLVDSRPSQHSLRHFNRFIQAGLNELMESKGGKKKSSSSSSKSLFYEAPLGYSIEDVRPNGGIKKFRSAAYSNCARKPS